MKFETNEIKTQNAEKGKRNKMEAKTTTARRSRRKPLSDCTNTTINSQSSSTSTKLSCSNINKPTRPLLSSALHNLSNANTARNNPCTAKSDRTALVSVPFSSAPSRPLNSSSLVTGAATGEVAEPYSSYGGQQSGDKRKGKEKAHGSTPSQPSKCLALAGTANCEVREPCSIYSRRKSFDRSKNKGKEIAVPMSCFPMVKSQFTGNKMNEGVVINQSKSRTVPCKKRQRQTAPEDAEKHALPQEFIEQQRAYFAEIDAFELSEEEVASINELE